MADSTTPSLPKQGGGPFIAAAFAMVLVTAGLLYWKLGGKNEAPPAPPPPAVVKASEPVLEEPPPPPPAETPKEEAKPDDTKKKAVSVGSGACPAVCEGEPTPALSEGLRSLAQQAKRPCYERALRQDSTLSGQMTVAVKVDSRGNVCSAGLAESTLGQPSVASCVVQRFRGARLPAPKGGCADVRVPISFKTQ